jgi:hypothetical protein
MLLLISTFYRIKDSSGAGTATLPEHLSSPSVFSGVRVTRSLVLCVCFVDRCLSFCPFSFKSSYIQIIQTYVYLNHMRTSENVYMLINIYVRRVWRYQKGNQNPYIEEEQTTQWPKEKGQKDKQRSTKKVQKDKQRSTKHARKTNDRVTRTPLKTEGELRCFGRVSSSCYICF